jgi:sulfite exporter TauE/SafE
MLAFWLGTIPALAASGSVLPRLAAPILRRAPYAGGVLIVVVGVVMILTRTTGMARAATPDDPDAALPRCCHAP